MYHQLIIYGKNPAKKTLQEKGGGKRLGPLRTGTELLWTSHVSITIKPGGIKTPPSLDCLGLHGHPQWLLKEPTSDYRERQLPWV